MVEIWKNAHVNFPDGLAECQQLLEGLKTNGEASLSGYMLCGATFVEQDTQYLGQTRGFTFHTVRVKHEDVPRPDQTAFYNLTLTLRPDNSERKQLLAYLEDHIAGVRKAQSIVDLLRR